MDYADFKKIVSKSKLKMTIISLVIALIGAGMLVAHIVTGENKVAFWIVTGIFLAFGVPLLIVSMRDMMQIRSDQWPLLRAIRENDKKFVVWIYINQINQKVEGLDVGKSYNVVLYTHNNKMIQIVSGRKHPGTTIVSYLHSIFPDAYVGYTDENRTAVGKLLNRKL